MPDEPISWSYTISGDCRTVVSVTSGPEVTEVTYNGEPMVNTEPGVWMDPRTADGTDAPQEDR